MNSSSGFFSSLLLVAFIVLKLCGVIDWSWFWVLSPIWITVGIVFLAFVVYAVLKSSEDKKPKEPQKSKWQERLEEIQKRQKHSVNN